MSYIDGLSDRDLSKSQLASLRRLEKKATITMAMEMDDAMAAALEQIYQAILELRAALAGLPAPVVNIPDFPSLPTPVVHVEPPDLSAIVTAVTGLKPGADAEDIARAIAGVIAPNQPASESGAEALSSVAAALEKLDFRLKGLGTQAYGGGSVSLLPNQQVGISNWADMPEVEVTASTSGTGTSANVASSATSVTLLAANAARKGATIYNDSTSVLRVKLGATASATSFSVVLAALTSGIGGYYEVPASYTGIIDGIWDSANGAARVTELT